MYAGVMVYRTWAAVTFSKQEITQYYASPVENQKFT